MTPQPLGSLYPPQWRTVRSRFVLRLNPSKRQVAGRSADTLVSFVPMEAIGEWGGLDTSASRNLGDVQTGYTFFRDGDVLVAKITPCFENGKGAFAEGLLGGFGFGTTELHVMSPSRELDSRFLFYVTISHPFRLLGQGEMFGAGGQKRVPESFLLDFAIGLPSVEEQRARVSLLNRKTAAIDALIAKKERIVELLQEKRQALITQAVTKGLDPNVPMRDSGNAWLGQVPAHWIVCRTKHAMSRIVDCPHETPEISPDFEYPAVRTSDVDRGRLFLEQAQRVSEETYRDRTRRLVPKEGDILYSREGGRFGHAALVPPSVSLCLGQRMMLFRTRQRCVPAYFMWVLNADCTFRQVTQDTLGSAAPRVNIPTVANAWVPCPPREEQSAIAAHIEEGLRRLDALGACVESTVETLREYRQAIITATVTGKIDVAKEVA